MNDPTRFTFCAMAETANTKGQIAKLRKRLLSGLSETDGLLQHILTIVIFVGLKDY